MDNAAAIHNTKDGPTTSDITPKGPGLTTGRWSLGPRMTNRRLRIVPWQGDRYVALIGPVKSGRPPNSDEVRHGLGELTRRGVYRAVTPAMTPFEAEPFFQAGFRLFERLHLLSCPVVVGAGRQIKTPARLYAGRPWHDRAVLAVDGRAFQGFWRFDHLALGEAKTATPARRFRVAKVGGRIVGYAVTGRAGHRGYLQRLAVDPSVQGQKIGKQLVYDSFDWLARRGADLSLVNTQETNERALGLYESIGYRRQQEGLVVLRWNGDT
ncbi:MAG: GNAT family N-acetyltransferase [Actinomycetota bacterium]